MRKRSKFILLFLVVIFFASCNKDDLNSSLIENIGKPVAYDNNGNVQLNVALVSLTASATKQDNILKMTSIIDNIMQNYSQTRLITFGETALGLYYTETNTADYYQSIAETIPGSTTNLFRNIAQNKNIYIAFGLFESDNGKIYNSLVLIDSNGNIIAKHRKVNLIGYEIDNGISAGAKETIPIAYIDGIKTGLAICADGQDFWLTKQLTDAKIKLLIHSLADETNEYATGNGPQYNSWVISSNRTGEETYKPGSVIKFSGYHCISDPSGKFVHYTEGSERYNIAKINIYN